MLLQEKWISKFIHFFRPLKISSNDFKPLKVGTRFKKLIITKRMSRTLSRWTKKKVMFSLSRKLLGVLVVWMNELARAVLSFKMFVCWTWHLWGVRCFFFPSGILQLYFHVFPISRLEILQEMDQKIGPEGIKVKIFDWSKWIPMRNIEQCLIFFLIIRLLFSDVN